MFHIFNAPRNYPSFYEPYYDQFNFYDGRKAWLNSIQGIPQKAVHLFAVHWLHLEVENGGFSQYFFNSTSESVLEAIEGFHAIGMPEVANIVSDALAALQQPWPIDKEKRRDILENDEINEAVDNFNNRFYELADTDKFFRKLPKFVPFAEKYATEIQ